jgi:hypothetical protein
MASTGQRGGSKSSQVFVEIDRIRGLLRHGSAREGVDRIRHLCRGKLAREHLRPIAELARHAQMPELSIRLLNAVVRPSRKSAKASASDAERCEYAAALIQIGAFHEAQGLIASLDANRQPEVLMQQGLYHFRRWDWDAAVPLFESYARIEGIDPFRANMARLYLGAALVKRDESSERGHKLLDAVVAGSSPEQARVLYRAALTYLAQHHLFESQWDRADDCLARLERESPERDKLFFDLIARKWRCLMGLRRGFKDPDALRELASIRDELLKWGHWEYARSCDFYGGRFSKNESLLLRAYAGTPYPALRAKLESELSALPESLEVALGGRDGAAPWINVADGRNSRTRAQLKEGQLVQRLLETLGSDIYRPFRLPELHALLHPGDYFHPTSAPTKIHQIIKRLRSWLKTQKIPLTIEEVAEGYRLQALRPVVLKIASSGGGDNRDQRLIQKLAVRFDHEPFTVKQASQLLACSTRSASRLLSDAVAQSLLIAEGKGRARKYRIAT